MGAKHSIISPSSALRWGAFNACPASAMMEAQNPRESTEAANEGTCAHEVAASIIVNCFESKGSPTQDTRYQYVGKYTFAGVVCNDEIYDGAMVYVHDVLTVYFDIQRQTGVYPLMGLEDRLHAPYIHAESFGTCDCWIWDAVNGLVYVWDFKFGFGFVEAFENWQLLNYTAGILAKPEFRESNKDIRVEIRVCQPRAFGHGWPTRHWQISFADAMTYINQLRDAAMEALGASPTCRSGPHCRYCKARHTCEVAGQASRVALEIVGPPVSVNLTNQQLGRELEIVYRAMKAVEYRYEGLVTQVDVIQRKGGRVPGWELKSNSSRRSWKASLEELRAIGGAYKIDLIKEAPITAKQAMDKGLPLSVVETFTQYQPGKKRVVPTDESEGRRLFGGK